MIKLIRRIANLLNKFSIHHQGMERGGVSQPLDVNTNALKSVEKNILFQQYHERPPLYYSSIHGRHCNGQKKKGTK